MRTTSISLVLFLLITVRLSSQITLSTQAEVDAWDQSITVLKGTVTISGNSITNIDALSNITSIEGRLLINSNNALTSIAGLSNISSLIGNLQINRNGLNNFDGLNKLEVLDGVLEIIANRELLNLNGLSNLMQINGLAKIWSNDALTSIDGLAELRSVNGTLEFVLHENISTILSLSNLTSISGTVLLSNISRLTGLEGLQNITSISGTLEITRNNSLTNIDALSSLTSLTGNIILFDNRELGNIDGFQNLNTFTGEIEISDNDLLTSLDGLLSITNLAGEIIIKFNDALLDLDGLANITSITGLLSVTSNRDLVDLNGLSNLTSLQGSLSILNSSFICNIDGLSNLTSIEGNLSLGSLNKLENLSGLSNVSSISGKVSLSRLEGITNINEFSNLTFLVGELQIQYTNLTNIEGLINLTSVSGTLDLSDNDILENLNGLQNLSTVSGELHILRNELLSDCCSLLNLLKQGTNFGIRISNNNFGCRGEQEILDSDCGLVIDYEGHPPCIGLDNGSIKIYASNYDLLPFYYMWEGPNGISGQGESQSDIICINNLIEGNYSVTVTQPNDEEVILMNIELDPIASPNLDILKVNTVNGFNGLSNGVIGLEYSGGMPPYSIALSGPTFGNVNSLTILSHQFDNLKTGDYILIISDAEGVTRSMNVTIIDEDISVEECTDPMDIIILNLVSSAIDADEYSQSKDYFQAFFETLNLGVSPNDSQIAVAEWSGKNDQDIKIPITGDLTKAISYNDCNRSFTGRTDPLFALKYGYEYLLNNGRPNTQKVIIFTYDGCPGFSAAAYADELKELGVIIADIGIDYVSRSNSYQNILKKAASRDDLAYFASNFDRLDPLELYVDLTYANCSGTISNIYFDRDGNIVIDNVVADCPYPGFVDVTFTVSSLEQLSIPIGTPVSFYHNDPRSYGAGLISTFLIPCPIPPGESETFTIILPIETATYLFAVLNDDGQTSPAFDFPLTDIVESIYSNNVDDERICTDGFATLQALKSSVSLYPICEDIVQYTINVCNISLVDAQGVMIQDESPSDFVLTETVVNTNNCSIDNGGSYNIPVDCCVSMILSYNVENAAPGYYGDQDVFLTGPVGQTYIDFDGALTSAEDILLDGTEDCGTPIVTFQKEVNYTTTCVDHSLTYTFTIDNQSSNPLFGIQFSDILPAPLEWVYKPYDKQGLSISIDDFLEGQTASFIIDEIVAETTASFVIDVYVGYTDVEVIGNNTARIEGFPEYINGGLDFLNSNTTTTTILGDIEIISIDTITVAATEDIISLSSVISPVSSIEWSSTGDGLFSDITIACPTYTFGADDRLDTLIGLFIGVDTYCGQKGKSVFIKRECNLQFDPVNVLEVCNNQMLDATLSWTGGIGPYIINEIPDVLGMDASVILSDLVEGSYLYTLNDAMGCESEVQLDINAIPSLQTSNVFTEEHCDQGDGSLTLEITSGVGPYSVSGMQIWTDITDQLVIPDLVAGDYSFTITDSQGCSSEEILSVPAQLTLNAQKVIIQPDCDEVNGALQLSWTGNSTNYSIAGDIEAQDVMSPYSIDQLPAGSYQLNLIDEFGCDDMISFEIENIVSPDVEVSTTCTDTTSYIVNITTGDFTIVSDLNLPVNSISQNKYEIQDIPLSESIVVTVTDPSNGCNMVMSIAAPDCSCTAFAIVGDDQVISCLQEKVLLDASASSQGADFSYAWYNPNGELVSTEAQYETDIPGIYTFKITDLVFNCTAVEELIVSDIRNTPEAIISGSENTITCDKDTLDFSVSTENNVVYTWSLENGEEITGDQILVEIAGNVMLQVLDTITGCTSISSINVDIDTLSPIIILNDPGLLNCSDSIATIDASDSEIGNVTWLDSTFVELSETTNVLAVSSPGQYYFFLENEDNGCVALDSVVVSANYELPAIELEEEANLTCDEELNDIIPIISSNHDYDVTWTLDGQFISSENIISIAVSGAYIVLVKDQLSECIAKDTIRFNPPNEVKGLVLSTTNLECHDDFSGSISISDVIGGTADYKYFVDNLEIENDTVDELPSGFYSIRVEDALGCDFDTLITLTEPVKVLTDTNLKEHIVNAGRDIEVQILTNINEDEIESVTWSPSIDCENCLYYVFENVKEDRSYTVTIVNKNGCEESLELRLLVDSSIAIYLPNVISSNLEANKVFFPQSGIESIIVEKMSIYDRWGNLIYLKEGFLVNEPSYGWDGSYGDRKVDSGVYVYSLILKNGTEIFQLSGDVTLLR